jgi:hypothetical protein
MLFKILLNQDGVQDFWRRSPVNNHRTGHPLQNKDMPADASNRFSKPFPTFILTSRYFGLNSVERNQKRARNTVSQPIRLGPLSRVGNSVHP